MTNKISKSIKTTQKGFCQGFSPGFSLVEVMIATSLMALLVAVSFSVLLSGSNSWQVNSATIQINQSIRNSMDWMKSDLLQAGISTVDVTANGIPSSTITFKVSTGVSGGAIVWSSNTIQYLLSGTQLIRRSGGVDKVVAVDITSMQIRRLAITPSIAEISLQAQKSFFTNRNVTLTKTFKVKMRN